MGKGGIYTDISPRRYAPVCHVYTSTLSQHVAVGVSSVVQLCAGMIDSSTSEWRMCLSAVVKASEQTVEKQCVDSNKRRTVDISITDERRRRRFSVLQWCFVCTRVYTVVHKPALVGYTLQPARRLMVHSHTRWDGMGWAALVTRCVNASVGLPAHHITTHRVYECIINASCCGLVETRRN